MHADLHAQLLSDADLVAKVGAQLGLMQDDSLFTAISVARQELSDNGVSPAAIGQLRMALNKSVKWISPITLVDLRSGWEPGRATLADRIGNYVFFAVAVVLLVICAYTTSTYERTRTLYNTTLELQEARAEELATKIFISMKRNSDEIESSIKSGKGEYLEVLTKSLIDLIALDLKFRSYRPEASSAQRILQGFESPMSLLDLKPSPKNENLPSAPPNDVEIQKKIREAASGYAYNTNGEDQDKGPYSKFLGELRSFIREIGVQIDPLKPNNYYFNLINLRSGLNFLGLWVLPSLYGMLGATLFHLRLLLNPLVPNLAWMRIILRVMLGGFAGVVAVWFWTPNTSGGTQQGIANLTAFGIAFLVGFGIDVFFRGLDKLVDYASKGLGSTQTS